MPPRRRAQRQRNEEADAAGENSATRGRGARGRGSRAARGRGRGARGRGGRSGFIQASDLPANYQGGQPPQQAHVEPQAARLRIAFWPWDIQYPVEYDFNMDQALMEVRGLPSGHLFNDFELAEYITERLADYEYALSEMPAEHPLFHMENDLHTLYRFYPDVNWLQRENQVRRLKIQLSQEQAVAQREELINQMTHLLQGTLGLGEIVYSNQFVLVTAKHLKMADDSFTTEQSIDFILRCFVEGFVRGRGQPLTKAQREEYFQILENEAFHCTQRKIKPIDSSVVKLGSLSFKWFAVRRTN